MKVTVQRDALVETAAGMAHHMDREGRIRRMYRTRPGQRRWRSRIVESVALPSGADLRLLRVDGSPDYVEIGAGNGLQVVSPILRPGASPQALEYEIGKDFGVARRSGGGSGLEPSRSDRLRNRLVRPSPERPPETDSRLFPCPPPPP